MPFPLPLMMGIDEFLNRGFSMASLKTGRRRILKHDGFPHKPLLPLTRQRLPLNADSILSKKRLNEG